MDEGKKKKEKKKKVNKAIGGKVEKEKNKIK